MVNRRKFDRALYNPFVQTRSELPCHIHNSEDQRFWGNPNAENHWRWPDYRSNQHHDQKGSEAFRDFRHACSMCPGDFTHTSCKYCLKEVEEFAPHNHGQETKHDYRCSAHEPRRHYFNNSCSSEPSCSLNDYVPTSFLNNTRYSRNAYGQILRENYCEFCFKNGETAVIYKSHQLRNPSGSIACPLLKEYACCSCGILDEGELGNCGSNVGLTGIPQCFGHEDNYNRKKKFTCLFCTPNGKEFCEAGPSMRNYKSCSCSRTPYEGITGLPYVRRFPNGSLNPYEYLDTMNF